MIRMSTRRAAILLGTLLLLAGVSFQPSLAQPPVGGTVALTGARVINGTGAAPIEQATILVANGRIEAVGTAATVTIPAGAARVEMSGKAIVPGLINAHGHLNADVSTRPIPEKLTGQLRLYADYGIKHGRRSWHRAERSGRRGRASGCTRDPNDRSGARVCRRTEPQGSQDG